MTLEARESWATILVKIPTPRASLPPGAVEVVAPVDVADIGRTVLGTSVARGDTLAQLRVARHRVEQRRTADLGRGLVVGVTSARGGEGATTLAAQLGYVLAEASRARVALVEATFAHPALARALGVEVPDGGALSWQIARRLEGAADPWRVVALGPTLHAALEGGGAPAVAGALQSAHFAGAVRALATAYDFVVVDAPPVLGPDDAQAALRTVDTVVLAARGGASRGADLRDAAALLGPKLLGVVLVAPPT